jgi:hypothetical protein
MSNKNRTIIAFSIIAFIALNSACAYWSEKLYSTESPANQTKVEIVQENYLIERRVYLNAYQNEKQFVNQKLLYTGDWFDGDFKSRYPDNSWSSDSILRIGRNAKDAENIFGSIKVTNNSANRISYLLIETTDNKIVLFDVEPNASIDLRFPFIWWLSCQGEFAESKERFGSKATMPEGKKANQFEITLKDGVNITSPQVELGKDDCCAPDRDSFDRENDFF